MVVVVSNNLVRLGMWNAINIRDVRAANEQGCDRTWLVVAPIMSSTSAIHCSMLSRRCSSRRKRTPVVTIFRLPRIWYVAGSTYRSVQNCARHKIIISFSSSDSGRLTIDIQLTGQRSRGTAAPEEAGLELLP